MNYLIEYFLYFVIILVTFTLFPIAYFLIFNLLLGAIKKRRTNPFFKIGFIVFCILCAMGTFFLIFKLLDFLICSI